MMSKCSVPQYHLDFQEVVIEIVSAYVKEAETTINGERHRMRLSSRGNLIIELHTGGQMMNTWSSIPPMAAHFLAKWEPV